MDVIRMIPRYCIAHKKPQISSHLYDAIVDTPPRPDYEGLVAITAHGPLITLVPKDGLVGICGYRKILTHRIDSDHGHIGIKECQSVNRANLDPRPGHDFLLCVRHIEGGTILDQWRSAHVEIEWCDVMALAVEMGVFTLEERAELEAQTVLFEGGLTMGVFPAALVRETFTKLWPLYQEFSRRHQARFITYGDVQRRTVAYLTERLESYFILRELKKHYPENPTPPEIGGCLVVVNDGPWSVGRMPD